MVKAVKANVSFNGVELSKLDIDNLRRFESELTEEIIKDSDQLNIAETCNLNTLTPILRNCIAYNEQKRDFVREEIKKRYSLTVV